MELTAQWVRQKNKVIVAGSDKRFEEKSSRVRTQRDWRTGSVRRTGREDLCEDLTFVVSPE